MPTRLTVEDHVRRNLEAGQVPVSKFGAEVLAELIAGLKRQPPTGEVTAAP